MGRWEKLINRRWDEAIGDPEFRDFVDKHHRETEENIAIDHVNLEEKERLLRAKNYISQLPESLIYYHADDAKPEQDEYSIGGEQLDEVSDIVYERIMSFMAGAQKMEPKRKVYLGNKPDGTSDPINKGDMSAVKLTLIDQPRKDSPNLQERTGKIKYGVLMLDFDYESWDDYKKKIEKEDVYTDQAGFGLEPFPHLTILYGFHATVDGSEVLNKIKEIAKKPVEIELTGISFFEGKDYDVVKFDVKKTDILIKLNNACKKFPFTSDFPDYHPHVTIGYVKKGTGKKYVEKLKTPIKLTSGEFVFKNKDKKKSTINLK